MIATVLTLTCFAQVMLYRLIDRYEIPMGKVILLFLLLACNTFVFPFQFLANQPEQPESEVHCGMPALAVIGGFWILGTCLLLLTHAFYHVLKKKKPKPLY